MKVRLSSPNLPAWIIGAVVLLMKPVVGTLLEGLNGRIHLEEGWREVVDYVTFYRFLAMFLFSQSSGMSQEATIGLFNSLGFKTPSACATFKISNNLAPFHPTLRNTEVAGTWRSQRDATQLLNDFERQAWCVSKRLFYVPLVQ